MEAVYELVKAFSHHQPKCANGSVYEITGEIYEQLRHQTHLCDASKELLYILSQPHIRALLDVHDRVANREYIPILPDIVSQVDEEDSVVKVIKLYKKNEPLGVTIKHRESDGIIYIARVFAGGPADRSGMVQPGDEVHEVNGIPCKGRNIEQVVQILSSCDGTISLKLVPPSARSDNSAVKMRIRVHVTYDPCADLLIPCKDAGLGFIPGEVLEILNTDDKLWWQARRFNDTLNRTGLIPSRTLQERRANESFRCSAESSPSLQRKSRLNSQFSTGNAGSLLSPRISRKAKKNRKVLRQAIMPDGLVEFLYTNQEAESPGQDIHYCSMYEEVELYYPSYNYRPIILIGPAGVGKSDLMSKILRDNPTTYITPLTCTARPKKILETEGRDYHFLSKAEMESHIQQQRFLEYGEYKGHMYGLRVSDIKTTIATGKICILTCQPQVLHVLRQKDIKPYVVFIRAPKLDQLKLMKLYTGEKATRKLMANEMEGIVLASARIEALYSHMIDEVIVNTDYHRAYQQLVEVCQTVETESKWVPAEWLDSS